VSGDLLTPGEVLTMLRDSFVRGVAHSDPPGPLPPHAPLFTAPVAYQPAPVSRYRWEDEEPHVVPQSQF